MTSNGKTAENQVLINFVLDKSGSMYSVLGDTIGGFNQFREKQWRQGDKLGQRTRMSLTLFDTKFELRYVNVDIATIPHPRRTTTDQTVTRHCTTPLAQVLEPSRSSVQRGR